MSDNLPPGVSHSHPYFNPPDHSHEHLWERDQHDNPFFEDGAAIFHEYCHYSEGQYGEGWSCEETRITRCEVERVVKKRENAPDIAYLASEDKPRERFGVIERIFEDAIVQIEMENKYNYEHVDPPTDLEDGYVRVSNEDYTVIYKQ